MKNKKKFLIGTLIILLLLSMIGVSVYREVYAKPPSYKFHEVKEEEISSNLMVPGTVSLEEQQAVYVSPDKGTLKDIMVEEGQSIKKGTVLAKFENQQLQLEVEQNNLSIESNNMKITQLENQISDLKEQEKELSGGLMPDQAAAGQIQSQISQLEMELKVAQLDLKQDNLQKDSIQKRVADLEIKSTMDGIVLRVDESAAVSATGGALPAVIVGKMDSLVAKGLLSEYDTLKVSKGQKVTLRTDVAPDQSWPAEVLKVSTLPETQGPMDGTQAAQYPVIIKLSGINPVLKPGFQVIMEIETEKKTAIVLPDSAIMDDGDKQYVFTVQNGKAVRQDVETGIVSGSKVEITSGIGKGDKVIANPPESLEDGTEVAAK